MLRRFLLLLVLALPVSGFSAEIEARPLRGLKRVYVLIENLSPEATAAGLSQDALRTNVELRLRRMGIQVVPKGTKGAGYVYLQLNFMEIERDTTYAYGGLLSMNEAATLVRNKEWEPAVITWSTGQIGFAGRNRLSEGIGNMLDAMLNAFENDWLAVNR
jgi:hypothetical protein